MMTLAPTVATLSLQCAQPLTLRVRDCPLGLSMCFLAIGGLVLVMFLTWGANSAANSLNGAADAIRRNPDAGKAAVEKVAQKLTRATAALERFNDWARDVGQRNL